VNEPPPQRPPRPPSPTAPLSHDTSPSGLRCIAPHEAPSNLIELLAAAQRAAGRAYAPYSKFTVGAALLDGFGDIVTGANIENVSYGLTICAERSAVCQAIDRGQRSWRAIAVASPTGIFPCGACRQVLAEFGLDLQVWLTHLQPNSPHRGYWLRDLLPGSPLPHQITSL
jgi:cytidine deaminase